ncbi:CLAVATA3/ESR (CLE)-related protein 16 [Quillaja saponaria]|uniref:CLAVATA3/ESR (CLE)-related protein 16 n=1 Tax=Quillaja saponaria TaxID=32244 RepID=A0AAD7P5G6_QUISA|nr:CLAVATA3/ESR (CLE)-related protein 16 [Quillaja saponaria]
MTVFRASSRTRERRLFGAKIAIFFMWVILILALLSLLLSIHDEKSHSIKSLQPGRKTRFLSKAFLHTPSSPYSSNKFQTKDGDGDGDADADTLYGEDKRVVHTGPNPLHN